MHKLGSNVSVEVFADKIVITCDRSVDLGPSDSGKNILVAKTGAIQAVPGTDLKLGLNLFKPNAAYEKPAKVK